MPLLYWHPQDEDQVVGQSQTTFFAEDQNAEWWVGVLTRAVQQVSQAQAALSLVALWQDDPALSATVDEYFWQNPAPQPPGYQATNLWTFEQNEALPQPVAFQPDEDLWFVLPLPTQAVQYLQPRSFDPQDIVPQPVAAVGSIPVTLIMGLDRPMNGLSGI